MRDARVGWSTWRRRSKRFRPLRRYLPITAPCTRTRSRNTVGNAAWTIRTPQFSGTYSKWIVRRDSWSTIDGCGCQRCWPDGSTACIVLAGYDDESLDVRGIPAEAVDSAGALLLRPGALAALGVGDGD